MKDYEIVRGFIESPRFHKRWFELGFSEEDLLELQLVLLDNPKIGFCNRGAYYYRKREEKGR